MFRWIRYALYASLACTAAASAAPPQIVASPGASAPMPTTGNPVTLDVGKFLFLDVTGYEGIVTFYPPASPYLTLSPEAEGVYWGGKRKGTDAPAWHKVPAGQYPVTGGAEVLKADEFTFTGIPDLAGKRIGGTKQGEKDAGWHGGKSKASVACLGVSKGTVTIMAWGVEAGRSKLLAELVVDVGPRGPPDDGKKDDDKTKPTAKDIYIVVVRSAGNVTPAQANLISDVPFWNTFKTGTSDWVVLNPGDEAATKKGYADLAMKKQPGGNFVPVLIVLDMADGSVLYSELIPPNPTKDSIKTELAKVRK